MIVANGWINAGREVAPPARAWISEGKNMTGPELLAKVSARKEESSKGIVDMVDHPCTRERQIDAILTNQVDTANFLGNSGLQITITDAMKSASGTDHQGRGTSHFDTAITKFQKEHDTMAAALRAWKQWSPHQKMASLAFVFY